MVEKKQALNLHKQKQAVYKNLAAGEVVWLGY